MKYQFRPYAKMQPTIVTLTGKVYEKGEHPLYKDFRIIEVVDKEGEIHYAFEDELKSDKVKEQETLEEIASEQFQKDFNNEIGNVLVQQLEKQETVEEAALKKYDYSLFINEEKRPAFIEGAKWQQKQIGRSEFLQRLRGTLSDAEARRLIFETFKNK
jgi:hypothetical protein